MAQGAIKTKPKSNAAPKQVHSKRQASKVHKQTKRTSKAAADKVQKKFTAGMTARTEALLGERAGHLELIGAKKKNKGEKKGLATKGGSKKFG